nr:hypothetical protein [Tanacetum cinerariifolium]
MRISFVSKRLFNVAALFDKARAAKEDMRKAYKEWKNIPKEKLALIDTFLKAGAWK